MRKILSTLFLAGLATTLLAQTPVQLPKTQMERLMEEMDRHNAEFTPVSRSKVVIEFDEWYRFLDDWRALQGGFRQQNSLFSIFPDSFVKNIFLDENTNEADVSYQGWHSLGAVFDPNSIAWSDPDLAGLKDWFGYEVDSILFNYGYFRKTGPEVVDTMIVQVYRDMRSQSNPSGQIIPGSFNSDNSQFGVVSYDYETGMGANYIETIKIPLTEEDSTQLNNEGRFFVRQFGVSLKDTLSGWAIDGGQKIAVTLTYKPGVEYDREDTLFFDDDLVNFGYEPPSQTIINRFGVITAVQTPTYSPLESYNNGMFIIRWNRYEDNPDIPDFLHEAFYPNRFGNGTESFGYYPFIAFKVQAEYDTGIEDQLENGYGVGVYPNPAQQDDQMVVEFAVNQKERVNIEVYDLTGKRVKTITSQQYNTGTHKVTFNASELKPGMYIYSMTAGEYSKSAKFNIVR